MQVTSLFITAFLVGLSGAMMPGPLLTATIAESAQKGFSAGPLIVLGHALLELALVLALIGGLASFLAIPAVTKIIAIVGGSFLIYLGYSIIKAAYRGRIALAITSDNADQRTLMHPVWAGILVSVSNPFWSVWWATVGLSYLTMALNSGGAGIAAFYTGHVMADFVWYTFIAAVVTGGRNFLSQNTYNWILILCGVFLLGLGGYFIYTGFTG